MNLLSERLDYIYELRPALEGERGQTGLIKASGASKSVVNQWLMGKIKSIDIKYALDIERNLGISHVWLMTGEGDPQDVPLYGAKARAEARSNPPAALVEPAPNTLQWISPREAELLNLFRSCENRQQVSILGIATDIATRHSENQSGRKPSTTREKTD